MGCRFAVVFVRTREVAMDIWREQFDLIFLDLMLPDGSCYSISRYIKQEWELPVIILTALGNESSVVTVCI
ncbi:response regulator [uncultured Robinsoniella sp.]|uniref:response regulator n=1 Tax=uncultured Robinsoniella sp. TaxID=904190 RepID=UPI00374FCA8A